MGAPPGSQVAPLPSNLPFRLVSKTIGAGAYASIRKAVPLRASTPVIAVKFINKEHALRVGRLKPKQIELEISIHQLVGSEEQDKHIIRYFSYGQDPAWYYICMELADGGDLFDKIEADEGVGEEIGHFYFRQLMSAVAWCHSKGVAHRDIKPENMLLTGEGDLKLADFGLATNFRDVRNGKEKLSAMVCGSPPYIAPEIVQVGNENLERKTVAKVGYAPNITDVWSCAIVLFVLLVGNTPWDSPIPEQSAEYSEFIQTNGRPDDELWQKLPPNVHSLLRGMLKRDPSQRFSLEDIRKHPWVTQHNRYLSSTERAVDSVGLATSMMERLRVDFNAIPTSQPDKMDIDSQASQHPGWAAAYASTQPEAPVADEPLDWEAPPRLAAHHGMSASQPTTAQDRSHALVFNDFAQQLAEDPSMSQFTATPQVPLTLTQQARRFRDIMPSHSLARFYSAAPLPQLLGLLQSALHQLNIPVPPVALPHGAVDSAAYIRVKTFDGRKQGLTGDVIVERISAEGLLEVRFVKAKGDPLEWRRLFKRVTVLCREAVVVPH